MQGLTKSNRLLNAIIFLFLIVVVTYRVFGFSERCCQDVLSVAAALDQSLLFMEPGEADVYCNLFLLILQSLTIVSFMLQLVSVVPIETLTVLNFAMIFCNETHKGGVP